MVLFRNQKCPKCWNEFKITFWSWFKNKGTCPCGNITNLISNDLINKAEMKEAHKYSSYHAKTLIENSLCGCFYCLNVFNSSEIKEWTDGGETAICIKCGVDSVLPGKDKRFINKKFLNRMYKYWFNIEGYFPSKFHNDLEE